MAQADPDLLRVALTYADPNLLEVALTKAKSELLATALTDGVDGDLLKVNKRKRQNAPPKSFVLCRSP